MPWDRAYRFIFENNQKVNAMNTGKKLLLAIALVALCGLCANAQTTFNDNFNSMSRSEQAKWLKNYFKDVPRKEKNIRTKELMAYDVQDLMSGSSKNLELTRRELMYYSDRMAAKGGRLFAYGATFIVVGSTAGILVGVLSDATAAIIAGLGVGLVGGIVLMVKGGYEIMSAGELEKKSKLLVADMPVIGSDQLALGVNVLYDQWTQTKALGAGLTLSF